MKKRFLIPLVVTSPIWLLLGVGVADASIHIAGCQLGHQGACAELQRRRAQSAEMDKASAEKAKQDALEAERKAEIQRQFDAWKAANPDKVNDGRPKLTSSQAIGCEVLLQRQLNDPASFRRLNSHQDVIQTGVIRYSATNAFGGRVQGSHACA